MPDLHKVIIEALEQVRREPHPQYLYTSNFEMKAGVPPRDRKREPDECPCCFVEGETIRFEQGRLWVFRCNTCQTEWEINEDFTCGICGKETGGRFLICGDSSCISDAETLGII